MNRSAKELYERFKKLGLLEETILPQGDALRLEQLLKDGGKSGKDFGKISSQIRKSRSSCMIHYYNWKRSSSAYPMLKKMWRVVSEGCESNDYCHVCRDGGDVMVLCLSFEVSKSSSRQNSKRQLVLSRLQWYGESGI